MTNPFVDKAKENMGTIERLLKGLPIVRGYVDKDLRREADYRLRQTIASTLESEKQRMYSLQKKLLKGGGLLYMDDLDSAITRVQKLADRVKTASYGFAGLLDAVKIQEDQLDALHRFDVGLAARTYEVQTAVDELGSAVEAKSGIGDAIDSLTEKLAELNRLYDARHKAVEDPDALDAAPVVDKEWMDAADNAAASMESADTSAASSDAAEPADASEEKDGFFKRIFDRDDK
ncbi:MAG: hypothetical protein KF753_13520 [Caldilineaceae bacterium]|nr:hypothetical protein [Caldilineaceae bacterium]